MDLARFRFSTTCEFCKASLPAWRRIAGELAASAQIEVVGISVDSVQVTRDYIEEHGLEFPVLSFTERRLRALYRTVAFPQSLVLNANGEVAYARLGSVTEASAIDSIIQMSRSVGAVAMQLSKVRRDGWDRKERSVPVGSNYSRRVTCVPDSSCYATCYLPQALSRRWRSVPKRQRGAGHALNRHQHRASMKDLDSVHNCARNTTAPRGSVSPVLTIVSALKNSHARFSGGTRAEPPMAEAPPPSLTRYSAASYICVLEERDVPRCVPCQYSIWPGLYLPTTKSK